MNKIITYEIDNKKLKLFGVNEEKIIIFDFPIEQLIQFKDCFVVCLESAVGQIYNENVFGISNEGEILWQIEAIPHIYEDSPYTGLSQIGDLAQLYNWNGVSLIIEPLTGKIIEKKFSK